MDMLSAPGLGGSISAVLSWTRPKRSRECAGFFQGGEGAVWCMVTGADVFFLIFRSGSWKIPVPSEEGRRRELPGGGGAPRAPPPLCAALHKISRY